MVLEKLRDAELPDGVTPTLGPLATPIGELYRYVVEGKGYSDIELRELEDWVIEPRFRQVPGIADVTPFGGLVKQYQVEIDPDGARQIQPLHRPDRAGRSARTTRTPAARCSTTASSRW